MKEIFLTFYIQELKMWINTFVQNNIIFTIVKGKKYFFYKKNDLKCENLCHFGQLCWEEQDE